MRANKTRLEQVVITWKWTEVGRLHLTPKGGIKLPDGIPDEGGVYRLRFEHEEPFGAYVGQTNDLRRRMREYRDAGEGKKHGLRVKKAVLAALRSGRPVYLEIATDCEAGLSAGDRGRQLLGLGEKDLKTEQGKASTYHRLALEGAAIASALAGNHLMINM